VCFTDEEICNKASQSSSKLCFFRSLEREKERKKEREKERKREKETHIIIAVKNLIDPLFASKRRKGDDRGALPSTEKNYKHSADDNDVNDDDDKEEEEDRFFAHLAVRVLLREEDGHVGGDKASPAGD
jgi:hypothetical protein